MTRLAFLLALTEYKRPNQVTPLPLSIDHAGDKKNFPVENRLKDALKRQRSEGTEREKMEEALSEPEEDMDTGTTQAEEAMAGTYSPRAKR